MATTNPTTIPPENLRHCEVCGRDFEPEGTAREKARKKSLCPACEAEWWAAPQKCNFCGKDFTARKLGQRFCPGGICKQKWTIQQNAQKLAELRKGRQCQRKGYPDARNLKYRADCPNVVDAARSDQLYCSDACRDIANYVRHQDSRRAAAKAVYAKNPETGRERARRRRAADPHKAREADRARYPTKRARRQAQRAAELAEVAEAKRILALGAQSTTRAARRGPPRDEDKLDRIATYLDQGLSLNAMRLKIYPETPETAYVNTRQLFKRNRAEIQNRCEPETVSRLAGLFKKDTVT